MEVKKYRPTTVNEINQNQYQLISGQVRNDNITKAPICTNPNGSNLKFTVSSPKLSNLEEKINLMDLIQNSQHGLVEKDMGNDLMPKSPLKITLNSSNCVLPVTAHADLVRDDVPVKVNQVEQLNLTENVMEDMNFTKGPTKLSQEHIQFEASLNFSKK